MEEWEPDPEVCTCLSRVPHRFLGALNNPPDDGGLAGTSSALFSSPKNFPEVMIDGLRMGTFYDLVQHHSHEADAETSWRILWDHVPPECRDRSRSGEGTETDYSDRRPQTDPFFWSSVYPVSAATAMPRPEQLRELFEWIPGGPVLQLFQYRQYDQKTTVDELKFQIAYRFPRGAGMSYARYWEGMSWEVGAGLKEFGTSLEEMERFERGLFDK